MLFSAPKGSSGSLVFLACATDETKLWLSPSVKQHRNPRSGLPPVYQDFNMHHDWPGKNAIVDLPISMKGNSKHISSYSLNLFGAKNKDLGAASQTFLT